MSCVWASEVQYKYVSLFQLQPEAALREMEKALTLKASLIYKFCHRFLPCYVTRSTPTSLTLEVLSKPLHLINRNHPAMLLSFVCPPYWLQMRSIGGSNNETLTPMQPDHPEAIEEIGDLQMLVLSRQQDAQNKGQRLKVVWRLLSHARDAAYFEYASNPQLILHHLYNRDQRGIGNACCRLERLCNLQQSMHWTVVCLTVSTEFS